MIKLKDIFCFKHGLPSNLISLSKERKSKDYIPYLRPSKSPLNTIAGYVKKNSVNSTYVFSKETLYIGTDGQGSHSYAYVSSCEFVPNSNVLVLIPKTGMDVKQKLFYATIIAKNRWKFSYSRKPKKHRLKELRVPSLEELKNYTKTINFPQKPTKKPYHYTQVALSDRKWGGIKIKELFTIKKGGSLIKNFDKGHIPLVSSTSLNNGIAEFVNKINTKPFSKNLITVSSNGSVGETFYQSKPFYATCDVNVLVPKFPLNPYIAMFLSTVIEFEKYRFSYGRKWGRTKMLNSKIKLPITKDGYPDWQFMEYYIKHLPYSKNLEGEKQIRSYKKSLSINASFEDTIKVLVD